MKSIKKIHFKNLVFVVTIFIGVPLSILAPKEASADFCSSLEGLSLYSPEDFQFLGSFTSKFDSDSILNKFGDYGSKFSGESIFNRFGDYGSKFSSNSPWNKFASDPPQIIDGDLNLYGTLSINRFAGGIVVHPMQALTCFIPLSDSRLEEFLWSLDEFDGYNKINSPDQPTYQYSPILSCPNNSILIGDTCYCSEGYKLSTDSQSCVVDLKCPANSTLDEGFCSCNDGYVYRNDRCVTYTEDCRLAFGDDIGWGVKGEDSGSSLCYCKTGYDWNSGKTACEELPEPIITIETPTIDLDFTSKQRGKIFLQVESLGEAWYIHPTQDKRFYMRDGDTAYQMMRSFGLGITDNDLAQIPSVFDTAAMIASVSICSSNTFANRLKGFILLQVEQNGEAWYIDPAKCRKIYLKDGEAAYEVMRFLGLGITDADLVRIPVGEL